MNERKILDAFDDYNRIMFQKVPNYMDLYGFKTRRLQCLSVLNCLMSDKKLEKFNVIETGSSSNFFDGTLGLFFGLLAEKTGGKMWSVDINPETVDKSREIFSEILPNLEYNCVVDDSVNFLKNFEDDEINLIHLDSWDFNLFDPMPSALHGWREFEAIKDKLGSNSIIVVDDNYIFGTYVQWRFYNGEVSGKEIDVPIYGKGAHIYQWVTSEEKDWKLIGNHYDIYDNVKVIIQKK